MEINWNIKKVNIDLIKENPQNPRTITDSDYEKLKSRVSRLGFHAVIKCDPDYIVLGGNQRLRILKEMGLTQVNVAIPDRQLTADERNEIIITDNTHSGSFNFDALINNYNIDSLIEMDIPKVDILSKFDESKDCEMGDPLANDPLLDVQINNRRVISIAVEGAEDEAFLAKILHQSLPLSAGYTVEKIKNGF